MRQYRYAQDEPAKAASADHMYVGHGRQTKFDIEHTSMGLAHTRMIKVINRDRVGHGIFIKYNIKYISLVNIP